MKKYEMIEIQTNIEKIYKEVFGIPDIAEDTNFFEIGGNSILAAKVVQKIKTCLGINLAIQDIFEYVTVNLLISYIAKIYNEKTKMEEERYCKGCLKSIKQISCISSQKREPLWKWLGRLFMWSDLRKTIFVRIKIICWMNWKEGYRSI